MLNLTTNGQKATKRKLKKFDYASEEFRTELKNIRERVNYYRSIERSLITSYQKCCRHNHPMVTYRKTGSLLRMDVVDVKTKVVCMDCGKVLKERR